MDLREGLGKIALESLDYLRDMGMVIVSFGVVY